MGEGEEKEEEHTGRLTLKREGWSEIKRASGPALWSETCNQLGAHPSGTVWRSWQLISWWGEENAWLCDEKGKPQVRLLFEEAGKCEINHPLSPNLAGTIFFGICWPFIVLSWILTSVGYLSLELWVLALCWLSCICKVHVSTCFPWPFYSHVHLHISYFHIQCPPKLGCYLHCYFPGLLPRIPSAAQYKLAGSLKIAFSIQVMAFKLLFCNTTLLMRGKDEC